MSEQTALAHRIATWIGTLALLVAVALPVVARLQQAAADPWTVGLLATIGLVFVGSEQVVDVAVRVLRASKWGSDE